MFCDKCQLFWQEAISKADVPATVTSCEDVHWQRFEMVLHRSMRELKRASELRCPICRAILHEPTKWEHENLLANEDEAIDIVLDLNPNQGPHPMLSASFCEKLEKNIPARIPKRTLAVCAGLLADGEQIQNAS